MILLLASAQMPFFYLSIAFFPAALHHHWRSYISLMSFLHIIWDHFSFKKCWKWNWILKCSPLINNERWTSDPLVTDLLNYFFHPKKMTSAKPVFLASCAIFSLFCAQEHPLQQARDGHSHWRMIYCHHVPFLLLIGGDWAHKDQTFMSFLSP